MDISWEEKEPARPRILIIGAGFGGLACAKALGNGPARVMIVDRHNYHLFVPLLYQVATAALSPADIAEPVRKVLRRYNNIEVALGDVVGADTVNRRVSLGDGRSLAYDRLIIATGSSYNYFGNDAWAACAPGLKTITNARDIRARILLGFEQAEMSADPQEQRRLTTTIIVGGGPTGVEMAGAVAELTHWSLARDFRRIDPRTARVILVEAGPRILAGFPEPLAAYARARLERLGVEVLTGDAVGEVSTRGVRLGDSEIPANAVVWGAGTKASPAAGWLGASADRSGRIIVGPDLRVEGLNAIYAIGDTAACAGDDGWPLPALAQVAKQQGEYLGQTIALELEGRGPAAPFRFRNRGNTAVIGRNAAIFDFGHGRHLRGRLAWLLWALVHVYLLVSFEKRLLVSIQWLWRWLTYQRGARLITFDGAEHSSPSPGSEACDPCIDQRDAHAPRPGDAGKMPARP